MRNEENLSQGKEMKKITLDFVFLFICLCGPTAFGLDMMGPPAASLEHGQLKIGIDYSYSEVDLELNNGRYVTYLDGWFDEAGSKHSYALKNMKVRKFYANLGYGLAYNLDSFIRIGGTNARFGNSSFSPEFWPGGEEFDSHTDFSVGFGLKGTFYEEDNLKLGGLFQVNRSEFDGAIQPADWPVADDYVEMGLTEIQIAVGVTCKLSESFSVYGGPFFHFINGEWDDVYSEITTETPYQLRTSKYSWDIEEDSIGGYLGANLNLGENCAFNIEFQHTSAADIIGLNLVWKY
jgi:hypothetical protein